MATKPKQKSQQERDPGDVRLGFLVEDVEDDRDANERAWEDTLEALSSEGDLKLKILRIVGPGGHDVEVLFNCPPSDYPTLEALEDHLRGVYGPGKYKVQFKVLNRIRRVASFALGDIPKTAALPQAVGMDPGLTQLFATMQAEAGRNHSMMLALIAQMGGGGRGGGGASETVAMMTAAAELMKNFRGGGGGRGGQGNALGEARELLKLLAELGANDKQQHWAVDLLEKANPLLNGLGVWLARGAGAGDLEGDYTVVDKNPGAPVTPAAPVLEAQAMAVLDKLGPIGKNVALNAARQYAPLLTMLVNMAAVDGDPALYAEVVLDQVPQEVVVSGVKIALTDDLLMKGLQRPDALDILMAVCPAGVAYRPWFEQLIVQVRAALTERATSEPPAGNAN